MNIDGSGLRQLTNGEGNNGTAMVSRDGKTIYFSSGRTGSSQIWRMPSEGGEAVQVTKNGGHSADEGPAGDFIYYQKGVKGVPELWQVPVAGGEDRRLLSLVGYRQFAVRRDGIYFIQREAYRTASLQFYRFATQKTKKITDIEGPFLHYDFGLTVSPDGRSVLYTHPERPNSSLWLVEDFR